jgi:carboxyl-terminal processing protease
MPLLVLLLLAFTAGVAADRIAAPGRWGGEFVPFWQAWKLVHERFVGRNQLDDAKLVHGAIAGLVNALGDAGHTTYLSPQEWERMQTALQGHFEGVGATIGIRKQRPTILRPLPGSPAQKAGLKAGDVLLKVDDEDVAGQSLDRIVQRVRGPAGTQVRLTVLREDQSRPVELTITRARVDVPEVSWHMLPKEPVAHVALREFGTNADAQLREALTQARKDGARALILDLRGNHGGLKDQAVAVSGEFLPAGEVVFIEQDAQGHQTPVPVKDPGGAAGDLPVVVLVDEGTASAAEIFAGAMQDHGRAKLVGTKTFGTGTVLKSFRLEDGSAVLLAVDQWLTPKGREIWHQGITPDVEVDVPLTARLLLPEDEGDLDAAGLARSEDKQLLKALELLKKDLR